MHSTDNFLEILYNNSQNQKTLINCNDEELNSLLESKRRQLRYILTLDKYKEFDFVPKVKKISASKLEGHLLEQYDMELLPGLIFPIYKIEPQKKNNKTILYCHGHDKFGCKGAFTRTGDLPYHKFIPLYMVEKGYTVIIPEFIGYGDMVMKNFKQQDQAGCIANSNNLLLYGLNMAGLRVYQASKVLDFMCNQLEMDDISVYGVSGGGLVTSYLCAVDERPKSIIISSYANTYKDSIMSMHHCIDNYPTGILKVGECAEIISLAMPKSILISNGDKDHIFPLKGTKKAIQTIEEIYNRFDIKNKFKYEIFDGVHEVSLNYVFEFLEEL